MADAGRKSMPPEPMLTPLWALKAITFFSVGANSSLFRFIAVFYHELGLSNWQIGILQTLHPWMTFLGSLVWAAVCDATGAYKPILLVSNLCGALVMCSLQSDSEGQFPRVCASVALGSFMLSARAGLLDALTLKVVEEYRSRAAGAGGGAVPSYGQQRLWGSAGFGLFALLSGCAMGRIGSGGMFLIFLFCLLMTVVLVLTQLPARGTRAEPPPAASQDAGSLCRFDVWWFFSNLFVYGAHMALVESFLFVYLSADFVGASKQLLGASVSVMCFFEVPVYLLIQRLIDRFPLTLLLSCCHVIFAFRVFAYSILPEDRPYFVLFIEPLHGATMAAMWACSVELGRRLAPEGARARMQALVAGIYYRVASGAGSLLWGHLTQQPPLGYGFQAMYRLASVTILSWCIIWNVGWIYDGTTFQWFMCSGILFVGLAFAILGGDLARGMPPKVVFGGCLWALSNFATLSVEKVFSDSQLFSQRSMAVLSSAMSGAA
ncbi:malA [Symbiodinium sp. CCMP2456]|nr:malA [Symbiodinium sp. CCMP2456]